MTGRLELPCIMIAIRYIATDHVSMIDFRVSMIEHRTDRVTLLRGGANTHLPHVHMRNMEALTNVALSSDQIGVDGQDSQSLSPTFSLLCSYGTGPSRIKGRG